MKDILVIQVSLITLHLVGVILSVVIWDTFWEIALGPDVEAYIKVLRLRLLGLYNLQLGEVYRVAEVVLM